MPLLQTARVRRDDWDKPFMRHDATAALLYLYLQAHPRATLIGWVHLDWDKLAYHRPELTREAAEAALAVLVQAGVILYDGEHVRVLDYPEFQGYSGARVAVAMEKEYAAAEQRTRLFTAPPPEQPAPAKAKQPRPRKPAAVLPAPSNLATQIAERLEGWIQQLQKTGYAPPKGQRRGVVQVARAIDASGCDHDKLFEALKWAINHKWWRKRLLNQASFCKEPDGFAVLLNEYLSEEKNSGLSAFAESGGEIVIPEGALTEVAVDPNAFEKIKRRAAELAGGAK